jgi:hypothetical protein
VGCAPSPHATEMSAREAHLRFTVYLIVPDRDGGWTAQAADHDAIRTLRVGVRATRDADVSVQLAAALCRDALHRDDLRPTLVEAFAATWLRPVEGAAHTLSAQTIVGWCLAWALQNTVG